MFKKIKKYLEYRHNKKHVKQELVHVCTTVMQLFSTASSQGLNLISFAVNVMNECKELSGEKLVAALVTALAEKLETEEPRIYELIQYIAALSKEDIQKIITHAQVETLHQDSASM